MTAFSAEWLALREPADMAARSLSLTQALVARLTSRHELSVLDLGTGTGSNVRFLAEHLPPAQRWQLVDHASELLNAVPRQMTSWSAARGYTVTRAADDTLIRGARLDCRLTSRHADLLAAVGDASLYEGCGLVTASALLDLVSDRWLHTLTARCAERRACVLLALTYDGRVLCSPSEPEDEAIRELVNHHQRTDKGFSAALGPDATAAAHTCLAHAGYEVRCEPSDWVIDPPSAELQRHLIEGWVEAATAMAPDRAEMIRRWRTQRLAHVEGGRSHLIVGHTDLAAWPATG